IAGPIYMAGAAITFKVRDTALTTLECRVDDRAYGACSAPWGQEIYCLAMGAHTLDLRATDKAGNVTVGTRHFELRGWSRHPTCPVVVEPEPDLSDVPASTVRFTGGLAAGAWSTARAVSVTFDAAAAECALDDGAFAACDGQFAASGLGDGTHRVSVRA